MVQCTEKIARQYARIGRRVGVVGHHVPRSHAAPRLAGVSAVQRQSTAGEARLVERTFVLGRRASEGATNLMGTAATGTIEFGECQRREDGHVSLDVTISQGRGREVWRVTGDFAGWTDAMSTEALSTGLLVWATNDLIEPHLDQQTSPANHAYVLSAADVREVCRLARRYGG